MATNTSGQFTADIEAYIAKETLPLARRQLVAYQFGDPETLPKGRGTTWTATRFNRVPLPFAALSEGVPPVGETMSISQVTVTLQQWGDKITVTDVAEMTIKHPVMNEARKLVALQTAETLERNTFAYGIMGGTQVNYVNSRGSRSALVAGDVLNTFEVTRAFAQLVNLGAPRFMGDEQTDTKLDAGNGGASASANARTRPHYVAICHPFVEADLTQNSTFVLASSYSDINKLYNYEVGQWHGTRFCSTNMCPTWTGVAAITGTGGSAGSLATNTYYIQVTASDSQNQYESQIYQVSSGISVTGANGSISVTLPVLAGYTFNVYVGTTTSPGNLGLCASGPLQGPLQGQATQLAGGQTVVITGVGVAQTPPAAPATGVTVYPTFIIGRGAYAQVVLDDIKITWLQNADKSDPLNQLRVVGWKVFYGTIIKNNQFFLRLESTSAFNSNFG
jgi:N4-gp56 family major capsid protein